MAALIRLGGPLWLDELQGLDADMATTAVRYGERLGVRVLCPVIARGRALAIVGLSRVHRYAGGPFLVSLLRLFLTFFAKALENAELHTQVATAEQSYRTVFDALPAGAILVAADGAIRHLNDSAAACLGTSSEELEGHPIERAGSEVADVARQVLAGARTATAAGIRIGAYAYRTTAVSLRETGALVLLEPPGAETAAGAEAQKTAAVDEILEDMSRILAHNFKNALVPIKTCAELLPERYAQEAFRSSFFEVVRESIAKIDGWITRLLRISGPVAEPGTNEQTVALRDQLERGLDQALAAFPDSQVTIVRDYADGDWVRAKADIFAKMFTEICCNALDAIQDIPEPKLQLTVCCEQNQVIARVSDNGPGVDEDSRTSAFRPFLTSKLSGLGLGLTYVRKVAAAMGGTAQIEPGPETGTVVSVAFPVASAPVPLNADKRDG